ncbi:hypothetical protein BHE74_00011211, partial [Ensete ventricosum]
MLTRLTIYILFENGHSCSPNLINYLVLVDNMDCQLAHVGLYASRDVWIFIIRAPPWSDWSVIRDAEMPKFTRR